MDIFYSQNIAPMLIGQNQPPFDSGEYIYELKLDGTRCIAYLQKEGLTLRNKRSKKLDPLFPELCGIFRQVQDTCVLDGELVVFRGGKPDFREVQRRSLMNNPMKISLAASKLPASFVAFDILYLKGHPVHRLPLMERKALLFRTVCESERMSVSRHIENKGVAFYQAAASMGLEGIVAKKKDSKYYFGKTTKDWIKMKALLDEDFIVCGYYTKGAHTASVIIGAYDGKQIVYQGHVVMGLSRFDYQKMQQTAKISKEQAYASFPDFDGALWLTPQLVCVVSFMERTAGGGLRQPVFKGLRDDKEPQECLAGLLDPP